MTLTELREEVCCANRALAKTGLVALTWGNVSGISGDRKLVVIKPSGVAYDELKPEQMVVVDLQGNVVEGGLRPSSDTPSHVLLYEHFEGVGGITHTHSRCATAFAQARREIPCFGTTHADHFFGPIPVTRPLTQQEVEAAYEANTGQVIVERFAELDPLEMPGVLVAGHAPFSWGKTAAGSVDNAVALEAVARMAVDTMLIGATAIDRTAIDRTASRGDAPQLESYVLQKHYRRKHGADAYYGQQ